MGDSWRNWICLGGPNADESCTPGSDECGDRGQCATAPQTAVACIFYANGPSDLGIDIGGLFGRAESRFNVATAQEATFREDYPPNVFSLMPVEGFMVWDSHAFNLTKSDTSVADREPEYTSYDYEDPLYQRFIGDEILSFDSPNEEDRTFRYCSRYDNGESNPTEVRRHSMRPEAETCAFVDTIASFAVGAGINIFTCGCVPEERSCFGGPNEGMPCNGDHSVCGDGGVCDACPAGGGVTTEEEMFLLLGSYYVQTP